MQMQTITLADVGFKSGVMICTNTHTHTHTHINTDTSHHSTPWHPTYYTTTHTCKHQEPTLTHPLSLSLTFSLKHTHTSMKRYQHDSKSWIYTHTFWHTLKALITAKWRGGWTTEVHWNSSQAEFTALSLICFSVILCINLSSSSAKNCKLRKLVCIK